jgi:transposase
MRYQRTSAQEKAEIIELVRKSPLPVKQALEALGVPRSTYYGWLKRKRLRGPDGLQDRRPRPRRVWNQLREEEVGTVLEYADQETDSTSREIAYRITDHAGFSVSESTVKCLKPRCIPPAQGTGPPPGSVLHQRGTTLRVGPTARPGGNP